VNGLLLTSRKLVQRKLIDIESDLRGTLRNFGLKVGVISTIGYEARIRHLVEGFPRLAAIIEPLLTVRRVMRQKLEGFKGPETSHLNRMKKQGGRQKAAMPLSSNWTIRWGPVSGLCPH
jgi:hypothetical protein